MTHPGRLGTEISASAGLNAAPLPSLFSTRLPRRLPFRRHRTFRLQLLAPRRRGQNFYTLPENHFNCAVGAYNTQHSALAGTRKETRKP